MENGRFQVDRVNAPDQTQLGQDNAGFISESNTTSLGKYAKTFGQLTREALPKLDNYKDLMSIHNPYRPTLDELHDASTIYEKVRPRF